MNTRFKIPKRMLAEMRADLHRPHAFAHERVGFITAGVTYDGPNSLMLLARAYRSVDDADYVPDPTVGVKIGGTAMRKALQFAYQPRSALFHVHTHGGIGTPVFSGVDLRSGREFVPGFFHTIARMPHGMLVLSNDSATGIIWRNAKDTGTYVSEFVSIGVPSRRFGRRA